MDEITLYPILNLSIEYSDSPLAKIHPRGVKKNLWRKV